MRPSEWLKILRAECTHQLVGERRVDNELRTSPFLSADVKMLNGGSRRFEGLCVGAEALAIQQLVVRQLAFEVIDKARSAIWSHFAEDIATESQNFNQIRLFDT